MALGRSHSTHLKGLLPDSSLKLVIKVGNQYYIKQQLWILKMNLNHKRIKTLNSQHDLFQTS